MLQQPFLSLLDVLNHLLDDHFDREDAYRNELHKRTDAYKAHLEKCKQALAKQRSQLKVEVENHKGKKELREPSDSDLGAIAYKEAEKWIEQNRDERSLDLPRENTPFQHAVQVLIGDHHLTIVDDSGDWDIDQGNPAEEQLRKWLMNRRAAKRGLGELTGTTPLEDELKRLDTPVVVQSVLREVWSKYPQCADMGLPKPDAAGGDKTADPKLERFVTLLQAASMVNKTKNTLEKRNKKSPMPIPDVEGGGGTAAEWKWSTIRPWLEKEFKRQLPEHFPFDRFIRR